MTDEDEIEEAEREMREDAARDVHDPVAARFVRHHFVSKSHRSSRGRNAPRRKQPLRKKRPTDVDLIQDKTDVQKPPAFRTPKKFDFDVKDETPGVALNPNAPTHKAAFAVVFQRDRLSLSAKYRWVNGFDWASGIYAGPVSSYSVAEVNALFSLSEHWQLGANVSNLLNNEHYEMFGGDILGRRALAHLSFRW